VRWFNKSREKTVFDILPKTVFSLLLLNHLKDAQQVSGQRWKIEQFHREAKQITGIEYCQCRLNRWQRNHIASALLVWVVFKELADKTAQTIYQLKHGLLSDYLKQQLRNPAIAFS